MQVKIATCIRVSVYTDALTYGRKYEALSHNSGEHKIKVHGDNNRIRWFPEYCFDLSGADAPFVNSIWIEAENWLPEEWDYMNDHTDVTVTLSDGTSWTATFFTYDNIAWLAERNKRTGEELTGGYIKMSNSLLVDEVSRKRIEEIVEYMLVHGELKEVFQLEEVTDDTELLGQ